jgi:signal recognition particle receptor subunit beta
MSRDRHGVQMDNVKIVITGPFNAGKTQFISSISEIDVVSTEQRITDGSQAVKGQTTVAMDFGRITVDNGLMLYLYGTPGQKRFDFMWDILSDVVLVDSARPETFREAKTIVSRFRRYSPTPYVIAANKQDMEDAWPPEDMRIALKLPSDTKVISCVATNRESVRKVLLELLYSILESAD